MTAPGETRFRPGQPILHRTPFIPENRASPPVIADVRPTVVVEDSDELVTLWLPEGTPTKRSLPLDPHQPKPWIEGEWKLVDGVWPWHTLMFMVPGQWRATWAFWMPDWEFIGWYVNLEEPLLRTPLGFDSRDLQLDILVNPERRWQWKDEDDLARCLDLGIISEPVARRVRAEGEAAIADIEHGAWPFTDDMRDWRPDPDWPTPTYAHIPEDQLLAIHDEAHWTNPNRL